ncbi:hypothetical protein CTAYLR_001613 [Chrysophaeum taylorii]|uniref:Uncharacterized protein n=1 Tax=Chrysophaeum taylorii TaxID=2483200 RepID=A0AAD7XKX7_9STRA|nr:hypothetical protein CTAYLR_001613 [Chrysophaeum taylorii]
MMIIVGLSLLGFADALMAPWSVTAPPKTKVGMEPFTSATEQYKTDFPEFSAYGWGVSTKAERWNGRHAMFGWVVIIATGYAQKHGLIPDADVPLDIKQWGTLAEITPRVSTITNERAVILVANIHALMVSLCAAFCPLPFQDKLLLEPGEADEEPAGIIPPFETGITLSAEMYNGRLAMLGIVAVSFYSLIYQVPFLEVVDKLIGGNLL